METKAKTGTREWSEKSYNILHGCPRLCRYCYSRANALRFGWIKTPGEWTQERMKAVLPKIPNCTGWIMFPTTHDITPFCLETALQVLRSMKAKGRRILLVSKPQLNCIVPIASELQDYRHNVLFRFTIGSLDEKLAAFWEPNAPIAERRACLQYAFDQGFTTSVSMEPMLAGSEDAERTYYALAPSVRDKVWIGKMNKIDQRVSVDGPETQRACAEIKRLQADNEMRRLIQDLRNELKVAWKDSMRLLQP